MPHLQLTNGSLLRKNIPQCFINLVLLFLPAINQFTSQWQNLQKILSDETLRSVSRHYREVVEALHTQSDHESEKMKTCKYRGKNCAKVFNVMLSISNHGFSDYG